MTDTVWVTGASGFTGYHLVTLLREEHPHLRIVGIDIAAAPRADVDVYRALDLTSWHEVAALVAAEPPRWVVHLAGAMPPAEDAVMWRANVGGTVGLLLGLRRGGASATRVIGIGSAAEYAPDAHSPVSEASLCGGASPYGNTKLAQTTVTLSEAAAAGLSTAVARPFNLVGPNLPPRLVAGALVQQFAAAANGDTIRVGNTHTARDFLDVRDAVRAYWALATAPEVSGVYNVCSGTAVTITRLLGMLSSLTSKTIHVEADPSRVRVNDPVSVFGSPARIQQATGWSPRISLERSLEDMLAHA